VAVLRKKNQPHQSRVLEPDHLVGRGPQCSLRLPHEYVSAQHAVIRWNGEAWEVLDRGGRNGTYLNGQALRAGQSNQLRAGDQLAFGNLEEEWILLDTGAPDVMLVDVETSEALLASDGMVCVPSAEEPQFIVFRDRDGAWKFEQPDRDAAPLYQGTVFVVNGRSYRFCCPEAVSSTANTTDSERPPAVAVFFVSSDEEFVEFFLEFPSKRVELGSRSHNYMLVTLARSRLDDRAAGVPESSCGWIYKEALADALSMTPQQIDGEVFRARRHLAQNGRVEASDLIERRPRTKQIRFGIANIRIEKT
jgi:hypothetical protein